MTQGIRSTALGAGAFSPDGHFYWDGTDWRSTSSPDGGWRWNGTAWVPAQSPSESGPDAPFVSPTGLGVGVSILLGIGGAAAVVEALFLNDFIVFTGWAGELRFKYSVGFIGASLFAVTAVAFLIWFHRCYRNLRAFGMHDLQFSARWAIGWWFIPIAGLWKPYRAAVEIWKASDTAAAAGLSRSPVLVRFWWVAWLCCLLVFNFAAFAVPDNALLYWQSALSAQATVVAATLAIIFVWSVSASQATRWRDLTRMAPAAVTAAGDAVDLSWDEGRQLRAWTLVTH